MMIAGEQNYGITPYINNYCCPVKLFWGCLC